MADFKNWQAVGLAFFTVVIVLILAYRFAQGTHSATGRNRESRNEGFLQLGAIVVIAIVIFLVAPNLDFSNSGNVQRLSTWARDNVISRTGGGGAAGAQP